MKKVPFLTAIALTSLLASACTVTVGENFDDDDGDFSNDPDFVDFSDDNSDEDASDVETETDEETDTDEDSTSVENTSSNATTATDAGQTTSANDSSDEESTSSVDPTTSDDSTSSDPVAPVNPEPDQCEPPGDAYSCAECLHYHCSVDWSACCGAASCVSSWNQITECVANPISEEEEPVDQVDRCASEASPTGDQLDLSDEVQNLMSCVAAEFTGDDDLYGHEAGEGTCTLYCYGVNAILPPQD